jgi:hypothetical protein
MFSVSKVSSIAVSVSFGEETASGVSKFEWPECMVDFLEIRSTGDDFVDEILNTHAAVVLAEGFVNDGIGGDGDSGLVDFEETSLVDQIFDGFQVGIPEGDERLDSSQHVQGGGVHSDEGGVVDLSQSQETEDLGHVRVQLVDTKKLV